MINLRVQLNGQEHDLTADSRDVLLWERTGRNRSMKQLMDNPSMASLYELAHLAAQRQGIYTGTREQFEDAATLEFEPDNDETDPTSGEA